MPLHATTYKLLDHITKYVRSTSYRQTEVPLLLNFEQPFKPINFHHEVDFGGRIWYIVDPTTACSGPPFGPRGGVHPQYPHADPETRQDFGIFITTYYYNSSS